MQHRSLRQLRQAALSLWPNVGGDPAQITARAGHSVAVLLTACCHCIHRQDDFNQQIGHVLEPSAGLTDRSATVSTALG